MEPRQRGDPAGARGDLLRRPRRPNRGDGWGRPDLLRGDPDEQLNDAGDTLVDVLVAALGRGVDVRGLLWRSHWRKFGFHSERAFELGKTLEAHGGECLRDMRVRTGGAHHQKFVVLRHRDDPTRDVAYAGGIDLELPLPQLLDAQFRASLQTALVDTVAG